MGTQDPVVWDWRRAAATFAALVLLAGCASGPPPDAATAWRDAFCKALVEVTGAMTEDFGYLPTLGYEAPAAPLPGRPVCFRSSIAGPAYACFWDLGWVDWNRRDAAAEGLAGEVGRCLGARILSARAETRRDGIRREFLVENGVHVSIEPAALFAGSGSQVLMSLNVPRLSYPTSD
jgi:hypothetical protein